MPTLCVALTTAVGGREEGTHVARPTGSFAGGEAHVGDQQDVRQAWTDPGLDADFGGAAHGTVRWVRKEGVSMEVLHVRRKDMTEYKKAGLHHAEFYRDSRIVEWDVYKWMMRRARGQEDRARWDRRMRKMCNEWVALWGTRGRGQGAGGEQRQNKRGWCWTGESGTRPDRAYCCVHC